MPRVKSQIRATCSRPQQLSERASIPIVMAPSVAILAVSPIGELPDLVMYKITIAAGAGAAGHESLSRVPDEPCRMMPPGFVLPTRGCGPSRRRRTPKSRCCGPDSTRCGSESDGRSFGWRTRGPAGDGHQRFGNPEFRRSGSGRKRPGGRGSSPSGSGARTASGAGSPGTRATACDGIRTRARGRTRRRQRSAGPAGRRWTRRRPSGRGGRRSRSTWSSSGRRRSGRCPGCAARAAGRSRSRSRRPGRIRRCPTGQR
jgi:hypothetical protein